MHAQARTAPLDLRRDVKIDGASQVRVDAVPHALQVEPSASNRTMGLVIGERGRVAFGLPQGSRYLIGPGRGCGDGGGTREVAWTGITARWAISYQSP